ncbi:MAG: sulfatase-like hydrolase/transferase [Pirellulales bacterium]|nr:sulfatase-like hydrolase/transferase [Pirellulales bacterium]
MMTRNRLLWLAFAVVGAAALWIGLRSWPARSKAVNVLLVTLDTTRADRIGCYGHQGALTPAIDELARQGVLFERTYAPAPMTLPAHATILTGLLPPEHGLRTNGLNRLADQVPTLAEALSQRGYSTAAFVAAFVLDSKFGLDRGFQTYDDDLSDAPEADHPLHRSRGGDRVVDQALAWLDRNRRGPFFCWVHLYEPHYPYLGHEDHFGTKFAGRPYDAEIAFVDLQVGRLTKFLSDHGLDTRTVVVVAGDHGEGLNDHQERTHAYLLYNTTMQVPLVVSHRGRFAAGRRERAVVSLADLFPTLLDCLGLAPPRAGTGRSLLPALLGGSLPSSVCYGETDEPYLDSGWAPLRSLTTEQWKYIRTTRPELYDLQQDPAETRDLASAHPPRVGEMESQLRGYESRLTAHPAPAAQLSDQDRRTLASLGYAAGGGAAAKPSPSAALASPEPLPDVKDRIVYYNKLEEAREIMGRRDYRQAVEVLLEIVEAVPDYARAHGHLGVCFAEMGRFPEAERHYRRVLELGRDLESAQMNLGLACRAQGKIDDALAQFETVLKTNPQSTDAHWYLATTLLEREQDQADLEKVKKAIVHYSAVVRLRPDDVQALVNLSWLLATHEKAEIRDGSRAVRLAEQACKRTDYQAPPALDALAAAYAATGKFDDAARSLEQCLALPGVGQDPQMAGALRYRLRLYRSGSPYREPR